MKIHEEILMPILGTQTRSADIDAISPATVAEFLAGGICAGKFTASPDHPEMQRVAQELTDTGKSRFDVAKLSVRA
jgi:hypothetical protein